MGERLSFFRGPGRQTPGLSAYNPAPMGLLSRGRDWPVIPDGKYRIERLLDRGGMGSV